MKKKLVFLLFVALVFSIIPATLLIMPATNVQAANDVLVWYDEFNGTSVDTNKWSILDNFSKFYDLWFLDENATVSNGNLHLTYKEEQVGYNHYTGGFIHSKDKFAFLYGKIEVRAKVAKTPGTYDTFWFFGQDESLWKELDGFEIYGDDPTRVDMTIHWGDLYNHWYFNTYDWTPHYHPNLIDWGDAYHVYTVEWTPTIVTWYIDGAEYKTYTNADNIVKSPMFILLGNQFKLPNESSTWPQSYDIDYIRVYQSEDRAVVTLDLFDDLNKTDSHSSNFQMLTDDPENFPISVTPFGDYSRLGLTSAAQYTNEFITYHIDNLRNFHASYYYDHPFSTSYDLKFYTSPNSGGPWTEFSATRVDNDVSIQLPVRQTEGYDGYNLPSGTNYLKVEFPALGSNYNKVQLGSIVLVSGSGSGPTPTSTPTPTLTPTPTPVPGMTTVNDDSGSITYGGSWTDFNGTGRINGDEHHTNGTNNYAQFTFTGTEVRWVCTKYSNRGKADVYIDGAYQDTKDLYSSSVLYQQEIYTKTGLSSGSHTIKVVCNGTQNESSSDYYIDVDAFIYGGGGATPTPTTTPTTTPTPTPAPSGTNLALGETASASSTWSAGDGASNANDGDSTGTRWAAADETGAGQWLEIDFGTNTTFNRTITKQCFNRITGYKIQYWNGSAWVDAYTGGVMGTSPKTDDFSSVTASKVRLYITAVQTDVGNIVPAIWEFEVYNTEPSGTNLAIGETASASSTWSAEDGASKANDGDSTGTRWAAADETGAGQWLEIDFGTNTTFNRTITKQCFNRITGYKIQYWNGSAWVDAYTGGVMGTSPKTDDFSSVTASKVRLYITAVQTDVGNIVPAIWEFEIYNN